MNVAPTKAGGNQSAKEIMVVSSSLWECGASSAKRLKRLNKAVSHFADSTPTRIIRRELHTGLIIAPHDGSSHLHQRKAAPFVAEASRLHT